MSVAGVPQGNKFLPSLPHKTAKAAVTATRVGIGAKEINGGICLGLPHSAGGRMGREREQINKTCAPFLLLAGRRIEHGQ